MSIFQIDAMSRVAVYEQIIEQMETFILTGILQESSIIPSVRTLSAELSINPNTIQKAYSELIRRGIIVSVPGKGTYISEGAGGILSDYKKKDIVKLQGLMNELALAGITKSEMQDCIEKAFLYKEEKHND